MPFRKKGKKPSPSSKEVGKISPIQLQILGAANIAVAIVLLPLSAFLGYFSVLVVVPALIWLVILGFRLRRADIRLLIMLRYTHIVMAPFAVLLCVYGLFALRAARRSAEAGGGPLGAFGLIPIVMGLLLGSLSLVSLYVSYSDRSKRTTGTEQSLEVDSGQAADDSI